MFWGLAFLVGGNMSVGLSSAGELIMRVGPDATEQALAQPHTRLFEMTGGRLAGSSLRQRALQHHHDMVERVRASG